MSKQFPISNGVIYLAWNCPTTFRLIKTYKWKSDLGQTSAKVF